MKVHRPCHSDEQEQVNVIVHFPQSDSTGNSGPCISQGQLKKLKEQSSTLEFCSHSKMAEKQWGESSAVNINEVILTHLI